MMRALPIEVYRKVKPYDCSNGGISSRFDSLLLLNDEGFIEIDENDPPENLVKLVERQLFGETYLHIEPVKGPDKNCAGWMYGGNIACCSDGRFPSRYPLKIHDRQETWEQYDMLSR